MHIIKHFRTVIKHKNTVFIHCIKAGIPVLGLMHDLSKFSPSEFYPGAKYFLGDKSPTELERSCIGYSSAWMHHKGRNRHHFEYWFDYNPQTRKMTAVKMPLKYVKEMFCDRVAASKIYKGKEYTDQVPLDYFLNSRARQRMHSSTADTLENWLYLLAEKGEKVAFSHIKNIK